MRRKSGRSRAAAGKRSGSGKNHKTSSQVQTLKRRTKSHAAADPKVGDNALGASAHDLKDVAEEATDDAEFPEAVVLIGKTHWRCVPCMVLHLRTVSVDEHLNTHHKPPGSPPAFPLSPERGQQDSGQGVNHRETVPRGLRASEPEREEGLRLSQSPVEDEESPEIVGVKAASVPSDARPLQERGKNGGGGSRRSSRGRGRVFIKPLTNEDSDLEMEMAASGLPVSFSPGKRKTVTPVSSVQEPEENVLQADVTVAEEDTATPNKKPRSEESSGGCDTAVSYEEPAVEVNISKECTPRDVLKDLIKEKYVVFVGKSGGVDYPVDCESHFDNDPPLPIETPSLQADAFLPPATPLLPDIHGPPETPIPPETPHPPEVPQQVDPFHPSEASDTDCQQTAPSELLLPGVAPGIVTVAPLSSEHLSRSAHTGQSLVSSDDYTPEGLLTSKSPDKELTSASVCLTCGGAFESPEELKQHREEMVKFDIVSCNSCGDKFHGLHQLNIHVFTTHEKFSKKFCFLCDVDCLDGFELEEHLLEHTALETDEEDADDLETVQHTCKTCGLQIEGNLSDLMNHYHTTHDQYVCPNCYALFTDLTEYEDHKLLHCCHTDGTVVFSCPVSDCFQLCEDKEALMDHISWHEDRDIHEEQQSLLQCHYCSDDFRNITSLQRHLADTHNEPGLRPFVCELCKEGFSHSLELHQHNAKQHAGIKRYGCAYCNQRFAFRSAHRRHVASEHDVAATVLRM